MYQSTDVFGDHESPDSVVAECQRNVGKSKQRPRQTEYPVAGVAGLRLAIYPSGRRTYILRYRDPVTGRKTSMTLGEAEV